MACYADLSPCDYFGDDIHSGPLLAVGWLEPGHPFQKGDPGAKVYNRLKQLLTNPWQPASYPGGQPCQFCRYDQFYSCINVFVPGDAVTYVAPEGILHYIATHEYCPPPAFCRAVLDCPPMRSTSYFDQLVRGGWDRRINELDADFQQWSAEEAVHALVEAIGNAHVARVEHYWKENDGPPPSLPDLDPPTSLTGPWRYEAGQAGYNLTLGTIETCGFTVRWDRERKCWEWRTRGAQVVRNYPGAMLWSVSGDDYSDFPRQ